MAAGTLYITPTPIGNYDDITLRAIKILKNSDLIICEELKPARRLLSHLGIEKELVPLNEHNEREITPEIIGKLTEGKKAALISDAGTPLFSDPGNFLVQQCIERKINIVALPGANSLLPALVSSGLNIEKFYYYGWLSPKKEIRTKELKKLKSVNELLVFLETPYRLKRILTDIKNTFGENVYVVLAYKLTMPNEEILRGKIKSVLQTVENKKLKGEFVLIVNNRKGERNDWR